MDNRDTAGAEASVKKKKAARTAAELAKCALFVVLMVLGSYISIPFYPVALTFQTVVCVLSGLMLGPWGGTAAMLCYMVLGLIGVPVFSSGGSGIMYVFKPSFGYIIGFIAAAFVTGILARGKYSRPRFLVAAGAGLVVNYAVGIVYFIFIWQFYLGYTGLWEAVVTYNLLYLPKDIVLCALGAYLAYYLLPLVDGRYRKFRGKREKKKTESTEKPAADAGFPADGTKENVPADAERLPDPFADGSAAEAPGTPSENRRDAAETEQDGGFEDRP